MRQRSPKGFVWAILLLPVASCVLITSASAGRRARRATSTILCIGAAFVLSLWALEALVNADHGATAALHRRMQWLQLRRLPVRPRRAHRRPDGDHAGRRHERVHAGADLLAGLHARRPGYCRYFAYMSLFTASMLGLVLVDSIFMLSTCSGSWSGSARTC